MLITLIAVVLLILGIIGIKLECNRDFPSFFGAIGLTFACFGGSCLFICILAIILSHVVIDKDIYEANLERAAIVEQIEAVNNNNNNEDVSKVNVIKRTYAWNREVYKNKYWSKNLWTSWFYSDRYVNSLKYIK